MVSGIMAHGQITQQHTTKDHKKYKALTANFNQGVEYSIKGKNKTALTNNCGISLNKQLNNRWKIEGGINFVIPTDNYKGACKLPADKVSMVTVPATLQYYLLPDHKKVKAYIGAGVQYTANNLNENKSTAEYIPKYNTNGGNHYVSIVYTQGIVIEVNTKIQVRQSFHFIDSGQDKRIGLNIGIGFKIP
jgi:outer membrane protein W